MATLVSLYGVALAPKVSYGRNNFDALSYTPKAPESPPSAAACKRKNVVQKRTAAATYFHWQLFEFVGWSRAVRLAHAGP